MDLPLNQVIEGDCLEVMKTFPDKSFDLVLTDPPYGIEVQNNFAVGGRNDKLKDENIDWDFTPPSRAYFEEMERVSKEQIIWGANYMNCFNGENGAIVWNKLQPLPTLSQAEIASYSRTKKVYLYTERWTNFVNTKLTSHPTEKPIGLMTWLLENFSEEGDKILDPFAGSGTLGVAAHNLKRNFVLIEKDPTYAQLCRDRLSAQSNPLF